ncbi:hypothetical protein [Lentisalinibacter sediminis]|uniref:hypothetical protein n=1 Tax=Lentisalinibacter sediminis TaxID=2992237 RepID=UPI003866D9B7
MSVFPKSFVTVLLLTLVGGLIMSGSTRAQDEERPQPCAERSEFSQFDFWVGHWEVRTAKGELAGTNRITKRADGCALLEEWTSVRGGSGISVNYYDPAAGEWIQVWNGSGGTQITIRGGLDEEGAMALSGTLHYVSRGQTVAFRGLWSPLPDGRVRQYFEQSTDDGETWQPWFEGFYSRIEETGDGAE